MLQHKIKRLLGNVWPASPNGRKIILLYHSVSHTSWAISPRSFAQQIAWLSDNCQILPLEELLASTCTDNFQVALTFDDGYFSLYDTVLPLLSSYNITACVYVNTDSLKETGAPRHKAQQALGFYPDEYFLGWEEVRQLRDSGWLIGSHGVNHLDLTRVNDTLLYQELTLSKKELETKLKTACSHFSYPWGRYSERLLQTLKATGYQYAVAARHGPVTKMDRSLALPRINIANYYSFKDFKDIIVGKWDYLYWLHKLKGL